MESEARWGLVASAQVKRDASIIVAAYLSDHGWFMRNGDGFVGVSLVKWKPIPKCKNMKDQLQTKELSK